MTFKPVIVVSSNAAVAEYGKDKTKLALDSDIEKLAKEKDLIIYEVDWGKPHETYIGAGMMTYANPTYFVRGAEEADDLTEDELIEMIRTI